MNEWMNGVKYTAVIEVAYWIVIFSNDTEWHEIAVSGDMRLKSVLQISL